MISCPVPLAYRSSAHFAGVVAALLNHESLHDDLESGEFRVKHITYLLS